MCEICQKFGDRIYPVYDVTKNGAVKYRARCRNIAAEQAAKIAGVFALEPRQERKEKDSAVSLKLRALYDGVYELDALLASRDGL